MPDKPADDALVLSAREGAVLTLTLNRPQARNALSEGLMAALHRRSCTSRRRWLMSHPSTLSV